MKLENLSLFLKIVEKAGLAAAGRELGLSPATVSERLAALEAHYGVTLINRTTRAIHVTEEGRILVDGARQVVDDFNEIENRIQRGALTLSGLIRVSAPIDLGRTAIRPIADAFLADHPDTSIDLVLADSYLNIVDEGIDIAVRFGDLADSTLRVRTLGVNYRVVCAAPDYVARKGRPVVPTDLKTHNCILMRFGNKLDNVWRFQDGNSERQITVTGNRIANDSALAHDWCLAGHGVLLKSIWDVGEELASGKLTQLLPEYSPSPTSIQMLFPPSRSQPRRVRKFAERLSTAFDRDPKSRS